MSDEEIEDEQLSESDESEKLSDEEDMLESSEDEQIIPDDIATIDNDSDEEDVTHLSDSYKTKFTDEMKKNHLASFHPEEIHKSFDEIYALSMITRNEEGVIIDANHRTYPILSKYEKTKILGLRVAQLNKGSAPYVPLKHSTILDNSLIAEKELKEKKLPFIIMRPLFNGKCEYWNVNDLEYIA
jgi:DNA-directed RNA polymerase I, II, and III subunit RPABC2